MEKLNREPAIDTTESAERFDNQSYEPPRVESVVTPEEMEREILYAGTGGTQVFD